MPSEKKNVLDGVVEFSNGYPISLTVSSPISFEKIRITQKQYSEELGYPVLFLRGSVVNDGYHITMFHCDSVLKDDGKRSRDSLPQDSAEVVGLWDGESVTDLLKVISEKQDPLDRETLETRYVALQNQRFSREDLRGHPIGIEESNSIDYFRDKQDRGFVIQSINWHTQKIILAPTLKAIFEIMTVSGHRSSDRVHGYYEIKEKVSSDYLSISNHNEVDEKLKEFTK